MNHALRLLAAALLLLLMIAGACQKQAIAAPALQLKSPPPGWCDRIHFASPAALLIFHPLEQVPEARVQLPEEEEWVLFRTFNDEATARGMCLWLTNEQIAARREGAD